MIEGKNIITIVHERGSVKEFEKRILTDGRCGAFLPVSFVLAGEKDIAHYDCGVYKPMTDVELNGSGEITLFLEKCVFKLIDSCGYLINPKKMDLNLKTVFFSRPGRDVRFAYLPREIPADGIIGVLAELLRHIDNSIIGEDKHGCLKALMSYIEYAGGSLFDIVNYIGELKRELYACGWEI